MTTLEDEFQHAMIDVYETAREHGYTPTYFKQMLDKYQGVEAAKRLLTAPRVQSGLMRLWELGLLKHCMEAAVIEERFRELFTDTEIAEARRRLEELDFFRTC